MSQKKIKAVLLDLDMTLMDYMTAKTESVDAAVEAMIKAGLVMAKEEAYEKLKQEYFQDFEGPHVITNFLKNSNQDNPRILAAGINAYRKKRIGLMKPYPEVVETLQELKSKGYKLAIVSDAPELKAYRRLDDLGIVGIFDEVVTYTDTGKKKPSPEPFEKALNSLSVKPEEAIHVGDWPERDVEGANAMGMVSVHAKYGHKFPPTEHKCNADFTINNFKEILGVLFKLNQKT
tara:strand:+ start:1881 stop:2579 length:699 start_codon:yes stop_codon:yes gene_type:complete